MPRIPTANRFNFNFHPLSDDGIMSLLRKPEPDIASISSDSRRQRSVRLSMSRVLRAERAMEIKNFPRESILRIPIIDLKEDMACLRRVDQTITSPFLKNYFRRLKTTSSFTMPKASELDTGDFNPHKFVRQYINALNPNYRSNLMMNNGAGARFIEAFRRVYTGELESYNDDGVLEPDQVLDTCAESFLSTASCFPERTDLHGCYSRQHANVIQHGLAEIKGILEYGFDDNQDSIRILRQLSTMLQSTIEDYLVARIQADPDSFREFLKAYENSLAA